MKGNELMIMTAMPVKKNRKATQQASTTPLVSTRAESKARIQELLTDASQTLEKGEAQNTVLSPDFVFTEERFPSQTHPNPDFAYVVYELDLFFVGHPNVESQRLIGTYETLEEARAVAAEITRRSLESIIRRTGEKESVIESFECFGFEGMVFDALKAERHHSREVVLETAMLGKKLAA